MFNNINMKTIMIGLCVVISVMAVGLYLLYSENTTLKDHTKMLMEELSKLKDNLTMLSGKYKELVSLNQPKEEPVVEEDEEDIVFDEEPQMTERVCHLETIEEECSEEVSCDDEDVVIDIDEIANEIEAEVDEEKPLVDESVVDTLVESVLDETVEKMTEKEVPDKKKKPKKRGRKKKVQKEEVSPINIEDLLKDD